MTHVTCRLTAENRDQLRNPTLGNQVWATFTFLCLFILTRYRPGGGKTIGPRRWQFDPKIAADLRPSADGSAVRTSLVAGVGSLILLLICSPVTKPIIAIASLRNSLSYEVVVNSCLLEMKEKKIIYLQTTEYSGRLTDKAYSHLAVIGLPLTYRVAQKSRTFFNTPKTASYSLFPGTVYERFREIRFILF